MWKTITDEDIRRALIDQSVIKAPRLDRLGLQAIGLLWDWDSQKIIAAVEESLRLGVHPRVWKDATGVLTPKPNKPYYGVAKVFRVITLSNWLAKVVWNKEANPIAVECEGRRLLPDGQLGCRKRRSAIDMVGRLMKRVEEAWKRGNTVAVLLMVVKGAFPHVAKGNLITRMEEMGFEADLVRWVESCLEQKKVIMSMDGKEGDSMNVEMGVPPGSPVSPVLSVIYLSGSFNQVEKIEEECGSKAISFVDDVAWVVEGEDGGECTRRLERCAVETAIRAKENACQIDIENPDTIWVTQPRKL